MRLSILGKIINLLLPRYCPICDNRLLGSEEMLCINCLKHLPLTMTWSDPYENEMAKMFWHRIPIEKACSLFYYKGHAFTSNILYQLKYSHRPEVATDLGILLAQEGMKVHFFDDIDGIIPIPLAPHRQRQRGYNQSEEIARGIQEKTGLPIITDAIRRTLFTESQTHKSRTERQENVKHVFQTSDFYHDTQGKHPIANLAGKHLLIVDDVCTTGATLVSCCEELLKAGKMKFSITTIGWAHD